MGEKTGIQWCDATDNPIRVRDPRTGKFGGFYCVKISPGCTNCYAASMVSTGRFGEPIPYVAGPGAPELYLDEEMLAGWAKKTKPKKRFVSSMTDIAGEFVPDEWYWNILEAQRQAPLQTFLNLTKRAGRMDILTAAWMESIGPSNAPANIWPGFSAENQEWFDKRWPHIRQLAEDYGFIVWVSAEPLLGPIRLPDSFLSLRKKAWCIVGGESGSDARPMNPHWARDLRDQCTLAGVPFFFKQWGEYAPASQSVPGGTKAHFFEANGKRADPNIPLSRIPDGFMMWKLGKHAAGRLLDGQEWSQFPDAVPEATPEFLTLV